MESNEIAFRAEFKTNFPQNKDLYWRGQVLTVPHGLVWKKELPAKTELIPKQDKIKNSWNFKVTI
jgi:hypothetical protein